MEERLGGRPSRLPWLPFPSRPAGSRTLLEAKGQRHRDTEGPTKLRVTEDSNAVKGHLFSAMLMAVERARGSETVTGSPAGPSAVLPAAGGVS